MDASAGNGRTAATSRVSAALAAPRGQLPELISRYSPDVASAFRKARAALRKHFPRGYELVYDNTNALGVGYSPTPRPSDIVISVVAYPRWVTLFFFRARLLADPEHLLQGSGTKIRSLRLQPIELLESPAVRDLLAETVRLVSTGIQDAPKLSTVIRVVAARPRPRRPLAAVRKVARA